MKTLVLVLVVGLITANPSFAIEMTCDKGIQLYTFENGQLHLTINDGNLRRNQLPVLWSNGHRVVATVTLETTVLIHDLDFAKKLVSFVYLGLSPIEDQAFKIQKCK